MRTAIALLATLALAACGKPNSADGYKFETPQYVQQDVRTILAVHPSVTDLRKSFARTGRNVEQGRELRAYSVISTDRKTCTVHIVDPSVAYAPEWIGHEMTHCHYGAWHP